MFVAKDNQKTLLEDIRLWFNDDAKRPPDFAETTGKPINGKLPTAHGRWEQREIWTTTALNDYLLFPGVGQAFLIRRTRCQVRKGRVVGHLGGHLLGRDQPSPAHRRCRNGCCASTAATGPSKGPCIGSSMTPTLGTRTRAASAPGMGPRT